jgi:uncharacterized protein YacL
MISFKKILINKTGFLIGQFINKIFEYNLFLSIINFIKLILFILILNYYLTYILLLFIFYSIKNYFWMLIILCIFYF